MRAVTLGRRRWGALPPLEPSVPGATNARRRRRLLTFFLFFFLVAQAAFNGGFFFFHFYLKFFYIYDKIKLKKGTREVFVCFYTCVRLVDLMFWFKYFSRDHPVFFRFNKIASSSLNLCSCAS